VFAKRPECFFSITAFVFGCLFLLVIPPLQTPDEATHFLRAYEVSEGKFISQKVNNVTGDYLPASIQLTFNQLEGKDPIQFHGEKKYDLRRTKSSLVSIPLQKEKKMFYDTSSASVYSPIGYIPQALTILLSRVFDSPVIVMIYLTRIANLLVWIGIVYLSIRIFPWKKWAVAGVALLPMMVAQSISPGADVMTIGMGLLFSAAVVSTLAKEQLLSPRKILIILFISGIAMVASKQIMLILLPLVLLIPRQYFTAMRLNTSLLKWGVIAVPILMFIVWSLATADVSSNLSQIGNKQNTVGQIKYLLHEPWQFFIVLFNTFFFTWGDGVFNTLIGNFGWVDTPLAALFKNIGYVMVTFYIFVNYDGREAKKLISQKQRRVFLFIALAYLVAVCGALYVYYSPLQFEIIVGIQGRYLYPVLFLLVPAFLGSQIITKRQLFARGTVMLSIFLLTMSVITIIYRYYITYL
jgi:uncharacterized membrane protein